LDEVAHGARASKQRRLLAPPLEGFSSLTAGESATKSALERPIGWSAYKSTLERPIKRTGKKNIRVFVLLVRRVRIYFS
jgi:hypothetical protein